MIKRLLIFPFLLFTVLKLWAQDPQFSQFYAAPLYLSPSFTGSTDGSRAGFNFRDQWPGIPGSFITYAFSYDHYLPNLSSGLGLMVIRDQAGTGHLSKTSVGVLYSYQIRITKKWVVRPGLHFYISSRGLDFQKLLFNDQVSLSGNAPASVEIPTTLHSRFSDFAFSGMAFSEKIWYGFTLDHLNEPNESLEGSVGTIPRKWQFFGGYKYPLSSGSGKYIDESLTFTALYKAQGKYDQLDLGVYWLKRPLVLGVWYRGIPLFKAYKRGYQNNDAVVLMGGYQWENVKVGYSYDITISRLVVNTGGSHELSVIYEFFQNQKVKKKRRKIIVPCPKF
jgi:type IX secretion system PorP/SprF family membrane protein